MRLKIQEARRDRYINNIRQKALVQKYDGGVEEEEREDLYSA